MLPSAVSIFLFRTRNRKKDPDTHSDRRTPVVVRSGFRPGVHGFDGKNCAECCVILTVKMKESADGRRPNGSVDSALLGYHTDLYPELSSLYLCVSVFKSICYAVFAQAH